MAIRERSFTVETPKGIESVSDQKRTRLLLQ